MHHLLTADVGGTKTLLRISRAGEPHIPVLQKNYPSAAYPDLATMLDEFLRAADVRGISAACLALAGPVNGRQVRLTNLPWEVDADALATRFAIPRVELINDFAAVGYGIAGLRPDDLLTLQTGVTQAGGTRLVVGAGTGLGVAWLSYQNDAYTVHPAEAGHMDFAPVDDTQIDLLRYLRERHGHVSCERIVSGPGLVAIFEFLRDSARAQPKAQLLQAMNNGDAAAVIAEHAMQGGDACARQALELFITLYGAFVGNLALMTLPRGGIYIAGGIAAKIAREMQQGSFLRAFCAKGRFAAVLENLPLFIVNYPEVGLLGAGLYLEA